MPFTSQPPESATSSEVILRPGWQEVVLSLAVLAVLGYGGGILISQLGIDPMAIGLMFTALSGVASLAGFFTAFWRTRWWAAFGVKATTYRWLFIGVVAGVIAFVIKSIAILVYISLTGESTSPQAIYATGASGGIMSVVLATFFLAVLTPIGEEFLFRGVVTTALLRYGPVVGVVGGAFIFAVFHGINMVFPAALVVGLIAGEVFRRSGSIWPAVMVHAVVNLPTIPIMVLANAAQ